MGFSKRFKKVQRLVRDYFGVSRAEANGILWLLVLFTLLLSIQFVPREFFHVGKGAKGEHDIALLQELTEQFERNYQLKKELSSEVRKPEKVLTNFDPNSASKEELIKLGFPSAIADRLIKYRSKGGKFRSKQDLLKIYGLDSALYLTLKDYITLPHKRSIKKNIKDTKGKVSIHTDVLERKANLTKSEEKLYLDLNLTDTVQLKKIRGIGTVLAKRIVKYRKKLGGFVSASQLAEVYGLKEEVVKTVQQSSFIAGQYKPRQISINKANEYVLSSHPYISRKMADLIILYRFQHGTFKSLNELKSIPLIDEKKYQKLVPYLTIE